MRSQLKDLQTQLQDRPQPCFPDHHRHPKRAAVKNLVDLGIPELTDEQIEEVSQAAENAARKHIFSKINQKLVENLNYQR